MSNYPPGVTGHEPAIAGYPERTETVECHRSDAAALYRHEVIDLIDGHLQRGRERMARGRFEANIDHLQQLRDALDDLSDAEAECEWEGEVEGWVDGYDFEWTCPQCGSEHTEEGRFEPDPDEGRD
jgi:hypothetical protein